MVGEYGPNDKMLDPSILKPQTANKMSLLIGFIFQSIENILGKGDNADYNCCLYLELFFLQRFCWSQQLIIEKKKLKND